MAEFFLHLISIMGFQYEKTLFFDNFIRLYQLNSWSHDVPSLHINYQYLKYVVFYFVAFDVSADLTELGKTPVTVICAGIKSILDIGLTLEYLVSLVHREV